MVQRGAPPGLALALLPLLLAACGSQESRASSGSGSSPVEVQPGWYHSLDEPIRLLIDGGPLPIRQAPQGGQWAFVSARVRGISGPEMQIGAQFFEADSGALLFAERRAGSVVPSAADPAFVEPAIDSRGAIVHLPVCPIEQPPGFYQRVLRIELEVTSVGPDQKSGHASVIVTPDCADGTDGEKTVCVCECSPDYDPGKCY
ncbi:MAG: hypothetical protein IPI67_33625 [Myxococcales bacterium]|nr:hypothetical protein [Myxococcales bacterium]